MRQSVDGFAEEDKGAKRDKKMRNDGAHARIPIADVKPEVCFSREISREVSETMPAACAERKVG